jgi:hypothetical protein
MFAEVIGGPSLDMQSVEGCAGVAGTEPHASETGLMDTITYVRLDVPKATVSVAVAKADCGGEIRHVGVFENAPRSSGKNQTEGSGPNGGNLRPIVNPGVPSV